MREAQAFNILLVTLSQLDDFLGGLGNVLNFLPQLQ